MKRISLFWILFQKKKIVLSSQIKTFEDLKQSVKKDNDYVEKLNLYVEENFLKNFPSH